MDAVEFLKEWDRMCDSMDDCCEGCDLSKWGIGCKEYAQKHPEDAVRTVKGWRDKYPVKTRQSEFLKICPNAKFYAEEKLLDYYPCDMDSRESFKGENCKRFRGDCYECRKYFWLTEVDD